LANIFISCSHEDREVAHSLIGHLSHKGHRTTFPEKPYGALVAGNWRGVFTKTLTASDALVAVLSDASLSCPYLLGDIGAARVLNETKGMLLLPVLLNRKEIPEFLSDVAVFPLETTDRRGDWEVKADWLADSLDRAIVQNAKRVPRIFISHSHRDRSIAAALVALLEEAFSIENTDLRCTSVQRYMLTPGERTSERLRSDIAGTELVIGLLSPDTSESNYVLCELGASWGRDVPTFPVLVRGATHANVPSPLNERHSMSLETEDDCLQLVDFVASKTSLRKREDANDKVKQQAKLLTDLAAGRTTNSGSANASS
jgi:TIR domain